MFEGGTGSPWERTRGKLTSTEQMSIPASTRSFLISISETPPSFGSARKSSIGTLAEDALEEEVEVS